ncbi:MAG: hypothetical protein HZA28_05005 [Candidatus Omnitrophica bacterium]|nr:hypothetical protein [Candidatus Omnitrophota bacterium]
MDKKSSKQIGKILKESVNAFVANPVILFPFITTAFIQLLVLEVLYFSAQFPLVYFFGPVISRFYGETYLHYPQHLLILPQWLQTSQYLIFIFINGFLIAVAIEIIKNINLGKKTSFPDALRVTLPQYVHVCIAAILSFVLYFGLANLHGAVIARALHIRSQGGVFYWIKAAVVYSAPYINLLIGVLVTAIFAFVLPIIVIERKKVFAAIIENFKHMKSSFGFIFPIVLVPTLFYIPILLLQTNLSAVASLTFEGIRLLCLVLGIFVMALIDATVYTAVTTHYLLKKENS